MEKEIKDLLEKLDNETLEQIPASFYGMRPTYGGKQRIVKNTFHHSDMYLCIPYHKAISRIYDLSKVHTPKNESKNLKMEDQG